MRIIVDDLVVGYCFIIAVIVMIESFYSYQY